MAVVLGVDVGGSGVKGAPVDVESGELTADRRRIETPQPATPDAVADVVRDVVEHFEWSGPIGITVPAVVQHGVVRTAANIDPSWIGTDAEKLFGERCDCPVHVLNDADAAGVAEMTFGAGRGRKGVVLLATLGTGIGSALFVDSRLVPNTELGHLRLEAAPDAEDWAASAVRKAEDLSWSQWAERVSDWVAGVEAVLWPDLIIFGGGVSKRADKWMGDVEARTELVAAELRNEAGIVGAAVLAGHGKDTDQ
jgi:polyphosphate glucokinase